MIALRRFTLPAAPLLLAVLALVASAAHAGGTVTATSLPHSLDRRVLQMASPCPPEEVLAQPGDAVDSNGLVITLEKSNLSAGPGTLTFSVSAKDGAPVTGAMTYVTIRMPAMDHGVSAYPAAEIADGQYQANDVSLGMVGDWEITVQVIRQGRAPAVASYDVPVGEE